MDRLLVIDPNELVLKFVIGEKSMGFITLKNVMFTMPVAFQIISPNKKYVSKPAQGIIQPSGRATVEITMLPQQSLPEFFPESKDRFTVKSVVVPGGSGAGQVSSDWFISKKNYIYSDSGLGVIFASSCILRALVSKGSMEDVREMLERGVRDDETSSSRSAMHAAVSNGRPEIVQLLIEFGFDLEVRNRAGQTALHEAAAAGEALVAELLLANGASAESRAGSSGGGWTALHFAVNARHAEVARVLINKGADVNAVVHENKTTALHLSVTAGDDGEILRELLVHGANVDARNSEGMTSLHLAASQGDLTAVKLLLSYGADRRVVDSDGNTAYDMAKESGQKTAESQELMQMLDLLKLGDDLRSAARKGDIRSIKHSLKLGANVNGQDQHGWTALHCAAFKGHVDAVRLLVERGADISIVDCEGCSVLHCAAEMGQREVVQMLMKRPGVDLNLQNAHGFSAVQVACVMGHSSVAALLVEGGARSSNASANSKGFVNVASPLLIKKSFNNVYSSSGLITCA